MESESSSPSKKAIIGLVVIVLLVIAATSAIIATNNNSQKNNQVAASMSPSSSSSSSPSTANNSSVNSSYKDGSYSATGSYDSPGGAESIDVSVSLASGTITSVSITPHANDDEASGYQNQFIGAYKSQVVGKKISDINLNRVAGSSLTSIGFNNAIDKIESEAKV